jgi:hypothetical protein
MIELDGPGVHFDGRPDLLALDPDDEDGKINVIVTNSDFDGTFDPAHNRDAAHNGDAGADPYMNH